MDTPVVAPLVLAAGLSRRFGGAKLSTLFRGRPLLANVLDQIATARERHLLEDGVVVYRSDDLDGARLATAAGLLAVANADPTSGLSSSLRLGLDALTPSRADWALIFLADQPTVRLDVIAALVAAARPVVDLIRPIYSDAPDTPGHPLLVHRRLWERARSLTGDEGFRTLAAGGGVREGEILITGSNPDIDTPEDLAALEANDGA